LKLKEFVKQKVLDILDKHSVVVWYDAAADFLGLAQELESAKCIVLKASESPLKTRREADNYYSLFYEADNFDEANRKLLIYNPVKRGVVEEEKRLDPFEVYTLVGSAFGDREDQTLASLARQAMPDKTAEINRLFEEGRPDLNLLNGLEESRSYPMLKEFLGTENPADIIAMALADEAVAVEIDNNTGCASELLRLLEVSIGFKHEPGKKDWSSNRDDAASYILFSEFVYDLNHDLPQELSGLQHADNEAAGIIRAAAERMRSDRNLEETYIRLAGEIEKKLFLESLFGEDYEPGACYTFPFEERALLSRASKKVIAGDFEGALTSIKDKGKSIWRRDMEKEADWVVLERAVELLTTATLIKEDMSGNYSMADLTAQYAANWFGLDRAQRVFENAVTALTNYDMLKDVLELCRKTYRETISLVQETLTQALQKESWPPEGVLKQTEIFNRFVAPAMEKREKIAYFLVDGLRFEMGRDLSDSLAGFGDIRVEYAAGVLPSVTDLGMAALMPGAENSLRLLSDEGKLIPTLGNKKLPGSAERMKLLGDLYGDRFFEASFDDLVSSMSSFKSKLKYADLLVVRTQDPDNIAENLGSWRAKKYLSGIVGDIAALVKNLADQGFNYIVIAADHGHIFFPEILAGDIVQAPPGEWMLNKRRCLMGRKLADGPGTLVYSANHLGLQTDLDDICFPAGFKVFSGGSGYFHSGFSLQEAVVPIVILRAAKTNEIKTGKPEIEIRYGKDKFTSQVIGLRIYLTGSLFSSPKSVLLEAYGGKGEKATIVGAAADCDARDAKTGLVNLEPDQEIHVPVLLDPDFSGKSIEIRVVDPQTRAVWARKELLNGKLD
jgi:hypothetical protein